MPPPPCQSGSEGILSNLVVARLIVVWSSIDLFGYSLGDVR